MSDLTPEERERMMTLSHPNKMLENIHTLLAALDRMEREKRHILIRDEAIVLLWKDKVARLEADRDRLTAQVRALTKERDRWEQDAIAKLNDYSCAMIDKGMVEQDRDAWKHAAEQASGMHMAENILAERDEMKMKLRACEGERDALRARVMELERELHKIQYYGAESGF